MKTPALPPGPFPSTSIVRALSMSQSTIGTWADRGVFDSFDHTGGGKGRVRMMSLQDALATALLWHKTGAGIEAPEFDPPAAHRFADVWIRTRGNAPRLREMVLRFYGLPGTDASKVSVLFNEDLFEDEPEAGARITIRIDLDAIFEPLIAALAETR